MDKNIKNLQNNLATALRCVPNDKKFDEIYQDIVKITKKINLIETKNQKRQEKKADNIFQNWSYQNGKINNNKHVGLDTLQAIDDMIQKEQENLNAIKSNINLSSENDENQTLLG